MSFDDRLLNGVSALAAVVRSGGFAAAARSLNVSQPGISRAVARLEAQVGIRLLERTPPLRPKVERPSRENSASTWTLTSRSLFSDRNSADFSKPIRSSKWT